MPAPEIEKLSASELAKNRLVVKEQLSKWADTTAVLHEKLQKQHGGDEPAVKAALYCRTEAAAAMSKTFGRMLMARVGSLAFGMTIGPVVQGSSTLMNMVSSAFGGSRS